MKRKFTLKCRDVIGFFLDNGNKWAIQKQIAEGAHVSENHLGDHWDNEQLKKEGLLSKLVNDGILERKPQRFNFYRLAENLRAYYEIMACWNYNDPSMKKYVYEAMGNREKCNSDYDLWLCCEYNERIYEKYPELFPMNIHSKNPIDDREKFFAEMRRRRANNEPPSPIPKFLGERTRKRQELINSILAEE